jgi:phenylpyruvate tautomerase PptA (4-oxalocrotonate tautomerase family)
MPFINVKTNASVPEEKMTDIKTRLGQAITVIPGKSESWLMVGIEPGYALWFKGKADPAAMVEVSIFGSPSSSALSELTRKITEILGSELGIPAASVYVKYECTDDWGWNGSNF